MKRFIVFAYNSYYPGGGMSDYRGAFETLEEARHSRSELLKKWDFVEIAEVTNDGLVEIEEAQR